MGMFRGTVDIRVLGMLGGVIGYMMTGVADSPKRIALYAPDTVYMTVTVILVPIEQEIKQRGVCLPEPP